MKAAQKIRWLLILVGAMFITACGAKLPKISPPLECPSNEGQPTPAEEVLYGYLVTLVSGDFEHLQAFASPQAFEQAQKWWQSLSTQEQDLFRQNMNLLARIGTGSCYQDAPLLLYLNLQFPPITAYRFTLADYQVVDLIGSEYYLLYQEPSIVPETITVPLVLFMVRLQQVKVGHLRVEQWGNLCWLVHPYPGEIYGWSLEDGASALQCFSP